MKGDEAVPSAKEHDEENVSRKRLQSLWNLDVLGKQMHCNLLKTIQILGMYHIPRLLTLISSPPPARVHIIKLVLLLFVRRPDLWPKFHTQHSQRQQRVVAVERTL